MASITKALIRGGMPAKTRATVIERGTLPAQRVVAGTVATIAKKARAARIQSPALTVIGPVNEMRKQIQWFRAPGKKVQKLPLAGKKVVITRSRLQASTLRQALEERGAQVIEFPTIEIRPPQSWTKIDHALRNLKRYDWVVFSSTNGVGFIFDRLKRLGKDARAFAGLKFAAVGQATRDALACYGIRADLMPKKFTTEALCRALKQKQKNKPQRLLLFRADIAPKDFIKQLQRAGAHVTEVTAYRTVPATHPRAVQIRKALARGEMDFVTFTSSSTADHFFRAIPAARRRRLRTKIISIGPVTSKTIRRYGLRPYRQANPHTIPGLVRALSRR